MKPWFGDRIFKGDLSRRDFIKLTSVATAGAAVSSTIVGCAIDPVTGKQQIVLMSEQQEIAVDQQQSPHQFSSDYGVVQDRQLNNYVKEVGDTLASRSHRPHMPYNYQVVNATYVNAYTFPAGSIATTRGIMLDMDSEAQLAGLLGHEIGHVNARHTAERMTRGVLAQLAVVGATVAASDSDYSNLVSTAGGFGVGALLAKYSRDNEREADALGMEYMTRANHNPQGMVDLMDVLRNKSKRQPSAIEQMFSSHPMSDERYATAKQRAGSRYANWGSKTLLKERYMDNTYKLRKQKTAIKAMQNGETAMRKKNYREAERQFNTALKRMPDDYAALVMMAKCQMAQDKQREAKRYLSMAKKAYPEEGQAIQLSGINSLALNQFDTAYQNFDRYEKRLPGNPNTIFLKAVSLESMQNRAGAAREYNRYLKQVKSGGQAQHAYQRLVNWGYIK